MREGNDKLIYPIEGEPTVVYLKNVVDDPDIIVGEHTYYNDYVNDPRDFQKNNVLYHFPQYYRDKIVIGKYCSLACGTTFICPLACHNMKAVSTYPFAIFNGHWEMDADSSALEKVVNLKGPTIVGNDVWIGKDAIIMPGVTIGDGACVGTRSVVTKDVAPYTVVAGAPAKPIRKRFDAKTIAELLELKWWDFPDEDIREVLPDLVNGRVDEFIRKLKLRHKVRTAIEDIFTSVM